MGTLGLSTVLGDLPTHVDELVKVLQFGIKTIAHQRSLFEYGSIAVATVASGRLRVWDEEEAFSTRLLPPVSVCEIVTCCGRYLDTLYWPRVESMRNRSAASLACLSQRDIVFTDFVMTSGS